MAIKTIRLKTPKAPNLPLAPVTYEKRFHEQFSNVLRLYFTQIDALLENLFGVTGTKTLRAPYGTFLNTATQSAAVINTPYLMTYNTTLFASEVSIDPTYSSRIVCTNPGVYNFQFSVQLEKTSGSAGYIYIWPRINGVNVLDSASRVAIQGSAAEAIPAWNWVLEMQVGEYFELVWVVNDTTIHLNSQPAITTPYIRPSVPSVILTASFVSALPD